MSEHPTEYALCIEINGSCKCKDRGSYPCSGILEMVENDETSEQEFERINRNRISERNISDGASVENKT